MRCFPQDSKNELYCNYHDQEWGRPCYDDQQLFELLCLEGQQAGLSWQLILQKRQNYRQTFYQFVPEKVASMPDAALEACLNNPGLVRNHAKIYSIRTNAQVFLQIQQAWGDFATYLWHWVDGKPLITHRQSWEQVPTQSPLSQKISQDLKKRGMKFVGPVIIYSYLQAVGIINDHLAGCFLVQEGLID